MKIYFDSIKKYGDTPYFLNRKTGLGLHLAGKPKFIAEKFVEKYWLQEGAQRFQELLVMLEELVMEWKSPFVLYNYNPENDKKDD